jgi:hypothetical protein
MSLRCQSSPEFWGRNTRTNKVKASMAIRRLAKRRNFPSAGMGKSPSAFAQSPCRPSAHLPTPAVMEIKTVCESVAVTGEIGICKGWGRGR